MKPTSSPPHLWDQLADETTFSPRLFVTSVNRQGVVFLWPVRLPGPDGRTDNWSQSAMDLVGIATNGWVRVQANMNLGAYEGALANSNIGDPAWPTLPMNEILRIAFKDRYISSLDHPIIKQLKGDA